MKTRQHLKIVQLSSTFRSADGQGILLSSLKNCGKEASVRRSRKYISER